MLNFYISRPINFRHLFYCNVLADLSKSCKILIYAVNPVSTKILLQPGSHRVPQSINQTQCHPKPLINLFTLPPTLEHRIQ